MGLFSKKPKASPPEAAPAPPPPSGSPFPPLEAPPQQPPVQQDPPPRPSKPSKKKFSVDPVDFLALRSEMMDLRARLDASEQSRAIVETRLAALDATTTAIASERPALGGDDVQARLAELQSQLASVAETASAAAANAETASAQAAAAATVAGNASAAAEPIARAADPELLARIEALATDVATAKADAVRATEAAQAAQSALPATEVNVVDPGLVARLDQLSARLDDAPDLARIAGLEAQVQELVAAVAAPVEAPAAGPDPDTLERIDQLTERVTAIDAFGAQLSQLNARVTAQAEFGAQLGSLRDRITELSNETEDRRAAAVAATGDADLRDRVNAIADRLATTDGLAAQIAQLAERVAATDGTTRQTAEQVSAVEQRLNAVGTELANQVSELGRDIDGLAAQRNDVEQGNISDEVIEHLKNAQVKLAFEQARYEIAFRQDLAALAEQVRRPRA